MNWRIRQRTESSNNAWIKKNNVKKLDGATEKGIPSKYTNKL